MREFPNATPRPWQFGKGDEKIICGENAEVAKAVILRNAGPLAGLVAVDNAALIIHAVNTLEEREKLLEEAAEALRASQEAFEALAKHLPQVDVDVVTGFRIVEANRKARAFLAKLEARDA